MKLPNETELMNIAKMAGLTAIEYFNGMLTNSISVKIDSIDKFIEIAKTKGNTIFYQIDQIDDNNESISKLEIDDLGLDKIDRRILEVMINQFSGKPVGIDALATTVGEDIDTIEDLYEPYLIQIGFISRTPRGRIPLPNAYKHMGYEKSN